MEKTLLDMAQERFIYKNEVCAATVIGSPENLITDAEVLEATAKYELAEDALSAADNERKRMKREAKQAIKTDAKVLAEQSLVQQVKTVKIQKAMVAVGAQATARQQAAAAQQAAVTQQAAAAQPAAAAAAAQQAPPGAVGGAAAP